MQTDDFPSQPIRPSSLIISSLLNNPNANQVTSSRPGSKDIPPVHLSPVQVISPQEFLNYISLVGTEYDSYIRAKQYGLQQHLRVNRTTRKPSSSIFSGTEKWEIKVAGHMAASIAPSSRFSMDDASSIASGSPTSEANGFMLGARDTDQVPGIFATDDFELKNPRTFDLVSDNVSIVGSLDSQTEMRNPPGSVLALQEKLSNYLDIVETTLVDEISASGPAFFSALDDLKELQSRASSCVERIVLLREELSRFSTENADVRITSAIGVQKLANLSTLQQDLSHLHMMKILFDKASLDAECGSAHECISAMTDWEAISKSVPNMSKLTVVEEMRKKIEGLKENLGQADIAAFRQILMQDLVNELDRSDVSALEKRLRSRYLRKSITHSYSTDLPKYTDTEELRGTLIRTLGSLIYADQVQKAFKDYVDAVIREAKSITKKNLPSSDDDDLQSVSNGHQSATTAEKSNNLAKALRNMTGSDFITMLREIYFRTCTFVRRVSEQEKLLIDVVSASSARITQEAQNLVYSTRLASTVVEVCQARIVKLLGVRLTAHLDFSILELQTFYEINTIFNAECETLTGQLSHNLQIIVANQLKTTYSRFENMHNQSLTATVEIDPWQPAQLADRVQATVDVILQAGLSDPLAWQTSMSSFTLTSDDLLGGSKSLVVGDVKFMIPLCAASLLSSVEQFLNLALLLPSLRNDCLSSTTELLRLYNLKSRQLILGAGATRTAGLERITAKHLAITSQALAMIIKISPQIQAYFQRQCPGNPSLSGEFEQIMQAYAQHRREIHQKLVSIMDDRTLQICKQLADWFVQTVHLEESAEPSSHIVALVKVGPRHLCLTLLTITGHPGVSKSSVEIFRRRGSQVYSTSCRKTRDSASNQGVREGAQIREDPSADTNRQTALL